MHQKEQGVWSGKRIIRDVVEHAPVAILYGCIAELIREHFQEGMTFLTWVTTHELEALGVLALVVALAIATTPALRYPLKALRLVVNAGWAVRASGIVRVWPSVPDANSEGWASYRTEIEEKGNDRIRIMAFTGASTFSTANSPLYSVLERHRGDIEILLAVPESQGFAERVGQFSIIWKIDSHQARQQCEADLATSIGYCQGLFKRASEINHIEIRGYAIPPIWKMVISGDVLWAQYYRPSQQNKDMLAYVFRKRENNESSLYFPLLRTFNQWWKLGESQVLLKLSR